MKGIPPASYTRAMRKKPSLSTKLLALGVGPDDADNLRVQRAVVERYWNEGEEDPFPKPGPIGSITARLRNMFDAKLQAER